MEKPKIRKIWLTKYALSIGLKSFDAVVLDNELVRLVSKPGEVVTYYHKKDYEFSKKAAMVKAIEKRDKEIAKLQLKLKELEELTF